jgi:hypothetical protein
MKPNTLVLDFVDADFNININRAIVIESNAPIELFRFSVDWVGVMLKSLPYATLTFTKLVGAHYAVTSVEDPNYKGIIARLQ